MGRRMMQHLEFAENFRELTTTVRECLECAGVLVTQITESEQIVLANAGMNLPANFVAAMPLSHSICQHSVAMDFPLIIDDTEFHPLLKGNLAFSELGIGAYLGAPVHVHQDRALGAICALELKARRWTDENVEFIMRAAVVADKLIVRSA